MCCVALGGQLVTGQFVTGIACYPFDVEVLLMVFPWIVYPSVIGISHSSEGKG